MSQKPERRSDYREVIYKTQRWNLLEEFRRKAMQTMVALEPLHLETVVHGSIARGDVSNRSDIDVFIRDPQSSFTVETALEKGNIPISGRLVVQATPAYAMKAYIEIDEKTSVSFPLMKMRKVEREFYKFGGEITRENLRRNLRVSGVDKRLVLIEPTEKGHKESTVIGREEYVAKLLGISVETVLDRVHALLKRDETGRTGVFIKREVSASETFEMVLKQLADLNPAVRRRLRSRV